MLRAHQQFTTAQNAQRSAHQGLTHVREELAEAATAHTVAACRADEARVVAAAADKDVAVGGRHPDTKSGHTEHHPQYRPPMPKWGSEHKQRADTFLEDVSEYAEYYTQEKHKILQQCLDPEPREAWQQVRKGWQDTIPAWPIVCTAFRKMVGQEADQVVAKTRKEFVQHHVRQSPQETVAAYRLRFDSSRALLGDLPEVWAAQFFVEGLSDGLRPQCLTDEKGLEFQTVDSAFQYAEGKEQQCKNNKHGHAAPMQSWNRNQRSKSWRGSGAYTQDAPTVPVGVKRPFQQLSSGVEASPPMWGGGRGAPAPRGRGSFAGRGPPQFVMGAFQPSSQFGRGRIGGGYMARGGYTPRGGARGGRGRGRGPYTGRGSVAATDGYEETGDEATYEYGGRDTYEEDYGYDDDM
jgi:hypothetical protein